MSRVRAVLFDLDGTLIDSELHTDRAIRKVVAEHGGVENFVLPPELTRGRTWVDIAASIRARAGAAIAVEDAVLVAGLAREWDAMVVDVLPLPGAPEAVRAAASRGLQLGVVSSSWRATIDSFLIKLGVDDVIDPRARIGAEAVKKTKPDPEGYLLAARTLDVAPADCLVFEDSRAGLLAARAAGMRAVFVTCCAVDLENNRALAVASCTHYQVLPATFWDQLAEGTADLLGRSFT